MTSSDPAAEITPAFVPPYGPDFFPEDPILAYVAPLAVVLAGALILRRWRDQVLVAAIADVVFLAGFFVQFPAALSVVAEAPASFVTLPTIWIWLAIFLTLALIVHALKRVVTKARRNDAGA